MAENRYKFLNWDLERNKTQEKKIKRNMIIKGDKYFDSQDDNKYKNLCHAK